MTKEYNSSKDTLSTGMAVFSLSLSSSLSLSLSFPLQASFTIMLRTHNLASLTGHSVVKTANSIKEYNVGRERRQQLHSAVLSTVYSKYCSSPAKLSLASKVVRSVHVETELHGLCAAPKSTQPFF